MNIETPVRCFKFGCKRFAVTWELTNRGCDDPSDFPNALCPEHAECLDRVGTADQPTLVGR